VPQCPLCKRSAPLEGGRCSRCGADLSVLETVREMPSRLYNEGLDAARNGDDLDALAKLGAAAQFGTAPQPWIVLGKLFANAGAAEYAVAAFTRARALGAEIPETWMTQAATPVARDDALKVSRVSAGVVPEIRPGAAIVEVGQPFPVQLLPRGGPAWASRVAVFALGLLLGWGGYALWPPRHPTASFTSGPSVDESVAQPSSQSKTAEPRHAEARQSDTGAEMHRERAAEWTRSGQDASANAPSLSSRATPPTGGSTDVYHVRPGDSPWRIARQHLGAGRRWTELVRADGSAITRPGWLVVGEKLRIPHRND
jgi:hypothetical protein